MSYKIKYIKYKTKYQAIRDKINILILKLKEMDKVKEIDKVEEIKEVNEIFEVKQDQDLHIDESVIKSVLDNIIDRVINNYNFE